jgi:uncharacterized protein (UPF0335 family)
VNIVEGASGLLDREPLNSESSLARDGGLLSAAESLFLSRFRRRTGSHFAWKRSEETSMPATAAAEKDTEQANTSFARDQLKAIIERIERLEEEKKATSDDIRDVYAEAKGNGFDVKALRTIVRLRKMDNDERKEQEAVLETYLHALGMLN